MSITYANACVLLCHLKKQRKKVYINAVLSCCAKEWKKVVVCTTNTPSSSTNIHVERSLLCFFCYCCRCCCLFVCFYFDCLRKYLRELHMKMGFRGIIVYATNIWIKNSWNAIIKQCIREVNDSGAHISIRWQCNNLCMILHLLIDINIFARLVRMSCVARQLCKLPSIKWRTSYAPPQWLLACKNSTFIRTKKK